MVNNGEQPVAPDEDHDRAQPNEDAEVVDTTMEQETQRLTWRDRIRLMGWSQLLLLALALAALSFGGLNAWRSEASTTLLVIGTVLAVVALARKLI